MPSSDLNKDSAVVLILFYGIGDLGYWKDLGQGRSGGVRKNPIFA